MPLLQRLTLGLQILREAPENLFEMGGPHQDDWRLNSSSLARSNSTNNNNSGSSSSLLDDRRRRRFIPLGDGWGYEALEERQGASEGPLGWSVLPPQRGELGGPEPLGGASRLRAFRGQITEADLSDIFAVAYIRAGGSGSLKRLVFVQRQPLQPPGGPRGNSEEVGALSEFVTGAASFCARYVADIFTGSNTNR